MRDATARRLSRLHATVFRATRGRIGRRLVANDMLLLTTRGRRSGRLHTVPLLYLRDGDDVVVVASWGGRDYHPDWYLNLLAHPDASINLDGSERAVIARPAAPEERAIWWHRAAHAFPGYREYQGRTTREIPIVFLGH